MSAATRAQYPARSMPLPRDLFSHNDRASTWQASAPEGALDPVTTFTTSDFGRTLTSHGDGSDHGWCAT